MTGLLRSGLLWASVSMQLFCCSQIDSVHIFRNIPEQRYSSSLAETTGWRLRHAGAAYVPIGTTDLAGLNAELAERRPVKHVHMALTGLTHLGFFYIGKAAHVFCLADDEGLIIDLTARRQYVLEDWTDRVKVRALLLALGL